MDDPRKAEQFRAYVHMSFAGDNGKTEDVTINQYEYVTNVYTIVVIFQHRSPSKMALIVICCREHYVLVLRLAILNIEDDL